MLKQVGLAYTVITVLKLDLKDLESTTLLSGCTIQSTDKMIT